MKIEVALSYFLKISSKRYKDLVRVFHHTEDIWQSTQSQLKATGWEPNFISEFLHWKNSFDREAAQTTLEKENISCITSQDAHYPPLLKEIFDPPLCLFVRGTMPTLQHPLAVVGTRNASTYGKQITDMLVTPLAQAGVTIVSGLALGIDGRAHQAALSANGTTIAVLGGGVDKNSVQPPAHKKLAEEIVENGGAVLSEYPPFTEPMKYSFPKRNRIIAGMSWATLVMEAGDASGTLITAQCALDNNREVFAVPQNITSPNSVGVNNLLKMGAHLVTSAQDILDIVGVQVQKTPSKKITGSTKEETALLECLSLEPQHIDTLIQNTHIESKIVNSTLLLLEMKGMIKNHGGMMYTLAFSSPL